MEMVQTDQLDEDPVDGTDAFFIDDQAQDGTVDVAQGEVEGEGDEESVYMIQGVVCRKI